MAALIMLAVAFGQYCRSSYAHSFASRAAFA